MFASVSGYVVWEKNVLNQWNERGPAMVNSAGKLCYVCPTSKEVKIPENEIELRKA